MTKVVNRGLAGVDHTHICNGEIAAMLQCFHDNSWETGACAPQIETMYNCVEVHKNDPDPRILVAKWQKQMKRSVLSHFAVAQAARKLR